MQNLIMSIQSIISMFIAVVVILLTLVSSEIATISPPMPGAGGI